MESKFRQLWGLVEEQCVQSDQLRANHDALYRAMDATIRSNQEETQNGYETIMNSQASPLG